MDSRAVCAFKSSRGVINIAVNRPCQRANDRTADFVRNASHGLEVTRRTARKSCFNHIDIEPCQLMRDPQLLCNRQACARGLLAIPERRVKDHDAVYIC